MDAVCRDYTTAPISEKEKALFGYVARLTLEPATCSKAHVAALSAAGWTDAEIYDAVTVTSLFGFFNRWIDGTGVPDTPKGLYEQRLEQFGDRGYA